MLTLQLFLTLPFRRKCLNPHKYRIFCVHFYFSKIIYFKSSLCIDGVNQTESLKSNLEMVQSEQVRFRFEPTLQLTRILNSTLTSRVMLGLTSRHMLGSSLDSWQCGLFFFPNFTEKWIFLSVLYAGTIMTSLHSVLIYNACHHRFWTIRERSSEVLRFLYYEKC